MKSGMTIGNFDRVVEAVENTALEVTPEMRGELHHLQNKIDDLFSLMSELPPSVKVQLCHYLHAKAQEVAVNSLDLVFSKD